ncbi:MAG: exodeoxyribonuclease VII small subunit [Oscillospiraceae bacterium]|nr:exodeoxyribonuclease VII small subunit [Oscillospiraceae bacterium]
MDKTINFEQNIKELEDVVRQLEGGDVSLDQLLVLFEKGVGLAKSCNAQLDNAEQKINMLIQNKSTGVMEEVPMTDAEAESAPAKPEPPKVQAKEPEFTEPPVSDADAPPEPDVPQQSMMGFDEL